MSGNASAMPRATDRRVRRTREALGDALVELIRSKPFPQITVKQVLDRAGVSRSTFYTHYRGKDDLFLSDVEEFFEHMASLPARQGEKSRRVAPVREMLAHLAEARDFYDALVVSGKIHDVMELGRGHFARGIEQRLAGLAPAPRSASRQAVAEALAGALVALLSWWIDHGIRTSPAEMDDLFHRLVWSGVPRTRA